MTVNLTINVQNGAVTITVGGQTSAPALSPAADQPAQLGAVKAQKALGPLPGGNPANASVEPGGNPANASVEPGGNPANASVEPGAAPPGSGLLVIGPIVIGGCAAKGGAVTPPVNVPLAAQPAAQ
jgi:hypothetical protein